MYQATDSATNKPALLKMYHQYQDALGAFLNCAIDAPDYETIRVLVKPWLYSDSWGEVGIACETYELIRAALKDY